MADKILVDFDPFTGIAHYSMWDELADEMHFIADQNADPIIKANKAEANETPQRFGDMAKVASIPLPLFYDLKRRGIIDDRKKLMAWLRDPDNRFFLTRSGKIV